MNEDIFIYLSFRSCGYRCATFSLVGNIAAQRRRAFTCVIFRSRSFKAIWSLPSSRLCVYIYYIWMCTCSHGPFLEEAAVGWCPIIRPTPFVRPKTLQLPKRNRPKLVWGLKSSFQYSLKYICIYVYFFFGDLNFCWWIFTRKYKSFEIFVKLIDMFISKIIRVSDLWRKNISLNELFILSNYFANVLQSIDVLEKILSCVYS